MWFPNRSDTNRPVQLQKQARSLKFWSNVEEELYYPSSENKGADPTGTIYLSQLRDVTKALPGKLPVQIKFRLFPIDCDVRDDLF